MRIRLTRKLSDAIDGIDIANYAVGDVLDLDPVEARLLMAEEWAVVERQPRRREIRRSTRSEPAARAADSSRRSPSENLRRASRQMTQHRVSLPHGRRREDVLLDEWHDSRARTVPHTGR
jgi:hypothetical protein